MRTCVLANGQFQWGIHKPSYRVKNLRSQTRHESLGCDTSQRRIDNLINYPDMDVVVDEAEWIYEIANPLSFRGTTYIGKRWADSSAEDYEKIQLPPPPAMSFSRLLRSEAIDTSFISRLPRPVQLSMATCSTDPDDLVSLAHIACDFISSAENEISGLLYIHNDDGTAKPAIHDHALFEAVANNPFLPDSYKIIMVIRPGAQGASEIVGDYHRNDKTHIYEYLRRNSYIGGGHYAANMADDAIRYDIDSLSAEDMRGLRHLYYQRTYVRLAEALEIEVETPIATDEHLEEIRERICAKLPRQSTTFSATLWGWNFGFDYSSSGYRLHASHQQIHQQFAMIPTSFSNQGAIESAASTPYSPFSCGEMISEVIELYRKEYGKSFFKCYLNAMRTNARMDNRHERPADLIVWEDKNVILYVPKAQTSQWELQIMTKPDDDGNFPGNIIETDAPTRHSLDMAILKGQKALEKRGARMVTSIEYSKRFDLVEQEQPLLYCLLPKLPESPGAFSETQLRYINGHYPEDFAAVCRMEIA